ncbi:hypothetical protein LUZ60_008746 [Juncus effusus]|nr:hypothetical protein LUZ60_008746 [Juncus effusus]
MLFQLQPVALSFSLPSSSSSSSSSPTLPLFSRSPPLHFTLSVSPSALSRRTRQSNGATSQQSEEPRGFGSAAVYDTSLEEKLLNEIQRKKKPVVNEDKVRVKKESSKSKGLGKSKRTDSTASTSKIDVTPKGIRVRLSNLPKKKNIQRDLQMAFKGFRGILQIDPAVSGSKKTRDPICKGFAFVDLASQEIANRFVETYSDKRIPFGKIEKQINCCIVNQNSNSTPKSSNNSPKAPILERQLHEGFMGLSVKNKKDKKEAQVIFIDENEDKNEDKNVKKDGILSKFEIIEVGDDDDEEEEEEEEEEEWDAEITKLPLKEKKGNVGMRKRKVRTKRKAKVPKLSMPLRLKGKERDVLTGVFSKYSANSVAKSTNES